MDLAAVDRLLTTTRSVRRRLDLTRPVEPEVLERCIEIALQAPTGSNVQGWRFIVVTDPAKRAAIADIYRKARVAYRGAQEKMPPGSVLEQLRSAQPRRVGSTFSLDDHLQEVPVHVVPCVDRRAYVPNIQQFQSFHLASLYGSILPAVWSFMLALRSRGLGSVITTQHLVYEQDAARVLGIPDHVAQVALLPVAYFTGSDFSPARRVPPKELTYWNTWGQRR